VEALNGKNIDGKEWFVGRAQKKSEREQELRNKFEQERREKAEKFQGVNLYLKVRPVYNPPQGAVAHRVGI
jgi:polyadenylate-binding protein